LFLWWFEESNGNQLVHFVLGDFRGFTTPVELVLRALPVRPVTEIRMVARDFEVAVLFFELF